MSKKLSNEEIKTLSLSSLGGMLEFYDFIIFVFFTKVLGQLFFPANDPFWTDISTFSAFAAGYFARPVGGIVMAHFGDKFGRKNVFMLSILLMVIPTFILGLMPTYENIGIYAPIVLILIRILQGIAIGGELPGAWVFVCEHSDPRVLGTTMGIFTSAVVSGILLGSIVTLLVNLNFTQEEIKDYAWRLPFILGGVFGIISIFLRRYLNETPVFKEIQALKQTQKIPKIFSISNVSEVTYQIVAIFFLAFGNVFIGILSDRLGFKRTNIIFASGLIIFAFLFHGCIVQNMNLNITLLFYYLMAFSAGVMIFTPLFLVKSFPPQIRYSGISFAYNISYAIFGGITPIFFAWVLNLGNYFLLGMYMIFLGSLSIVLGLIFERKH